MQNKKSLVYSVLLMFIFPMLSLAHALKGKFGPKYKRYLLIVFITIYGSIITISEGNDGYRHWQNVYLYYLDMPFTKFLAQIGDILLFKFNPEVKGDLYIHVLSYFTGTLLQLPGLFFVFVSFVYAYFFAGSMVKLFYLTREKVGFSWLFYGFALVFILWKNIEGINTVRTWTGLWILFYACLSYYQTKKWKYILLMFVPPLVHIGFFVMAIPAWIVLVFGVRRKAYIVVFAFSFVATVFSPQTVNQELQETEVGANKVQAYSVEQEATSEEISEAYSSSTWYKRFYKLGFQTWAVNLLAFAFIIFLVYRNVMTPLESSLFSIGLLSIALSNSAWFLYALASRSSLVAGLFILATVVLLWRRGCFTPAYFNNKRYLKAAMVISLWLLVPFIFYKLADMIYYININMVAFPFIPWFTDKLDMSIREFISFVL